MYNIYKTAIQDRICTGIFFTLILIHFNILTLVAQSLPDKAAVKKEIARLNQEMEAAFNNNDMLKVAAFYADDGEIVDESYTVKGREGLEKYWVALKDKGRGWKLSVVEVGGEGEFVYQLGRSDLKYLREDKEANSITNFVLIWRKHPGGSYKIFRDYLTRTKFEKN
ncbi:YybH family protein [Flavitalea antarctica]